MDHDRKQATVGGKLSSISLTDVTQQEWNPDLEEVRRSGGVRAYHALQAVLDGNVSTQDAIEYLLSVDKTAA